MAWRRTGSGIRCKCPCRSSTPCRCGRDGRHRMASRAWVGSTDAARRGNRILQGWRRTEWPTMRLHRRRRFRGPSLRTPTRLCRHSCAVGVGVLTPECEHARRRSPRPPGAARARLSRRRLPTCDAMAALPAALEMLSRLHPPLRSDRGLRMMRVSTVSRHGSPVRKPASPVLRRRPRRPPPPPIPPPRSPHQPLRLGQGPNPVRPPVGLWGQTEQLVAHITTT
mmetsp:Transcript_10963/g.36371  ORF Transcript_10963/g.36371 Transcript_10963/m.36371 type:complete len:224 (+) Transcript_10963:1226-1897(+)